MTIKTRVATVTVASLFAIVFSIFGTVIPKQLFMFILGILLAMVSLGLFIRDAPPDFSRVSRWRASYKFMYILILLYMITAIFETSLLSNLVRDEAVGLVQSSFFGNTKMFSALALTASTFQSVALSFLAIHIFTIKRPLFRLIFLSGVVVVIVFEFLFSDVLVGFSWFINWVAFATLILWWIYKRSRNLDELYFGW